MVALLKWFMNINILVFKYVGLWETIINSFPFSSEIYTIKMTTVFKATLKTILILSKFLGLINMSYTLQSTGLLLENSNSMYYSFLEFMRMFILLICTYNVHVMKGHSYIQRFRLIKFWVIIITARMSEIWIIK